MTSLTQARLKELLSYNSDTGEFVWRVSHRGPHPAGRRAGSDKGNGYWQIIIGGRNYLAHRLAWLYAHGEFPPDQLDHINGNRSDNRLVNLRPATPAQNTRNAKLWSSSTSGLKGVSYDKRADKWRANITVNYKQKFLGRFSTAEEAHAAYVKAAEAMHGEFARAA